MGICMVKTDCCREELLLATGLPNDTIHIITDYNAKFKTLTSQKASLLSIGNSTSGQVSFGGSINLSIDISQTATRIPAMDTLRGFPAQGTITIHDEIITYASRSRRAFEQCTRGTHGTVARAHSETSDIHCTFVGVAERSNYDFIRLDMVTSVKGSLYVDVSDCGYHWKPIHITSGYRQVIHVLPKAQNVYYRVRFQACYAHWRINAYWRSVLRLSTTLQKNNLIN